MTTSSYTDPLIQCLSFAPVRPLFVLRFGTNLNRDSDQLIRRGRRTELRRLLIVSALTVSGQVQAAAQGDPVIAMVNATVVDVERGALLRDQSIVTSRGRITYVGPAAGARIPRGAMRIDLRGRYVIPGLWDMHVHMTGKGDPEELAKYYGTLFVAHGVTGVRDAGGDINRVRALDETGRTHPIAVPRLVYAGTKVGPGDAASPWGIGDLKAAIAERVASGATYIKLTPEYPSRLIPETRAACAAAGVPCVAHVPAADTAMWVSQPGKGSYEHLFNLTEHVSRVPAAEVFDAVEEYEAPTLLQRVLYKLRLRRRPQEPRQLRIALRDTSKDAAFFGRLASSGTWITPTLVLHRHMTRSVDLLPSSVDPRLVLDTTVARAADARSDAAAMWLLWNGIVAGMSAAHVPMLAGTDFGSVHVPGAALHAELVLLQQAGVPTAEVLRMATLNPARYFGATDTLGSVAAGRVADLVVLTANPLDDIRHVAGIDFVMSRGRLFRRPVLDSLVNEGRLAAARLRAVLP